MTTDAIPNVLPVTPGAASDVQAIWPWIRSRIRAGRAVDMVHELGGAEGIRRLHEAATSPIALLRIARLYRCGGNYRVSYLISRRLWKRHPDNPWVRADWFPLVANSSAVEVLSWLDRYGDAPPEGIDEDAMVLWFHARAGVAADFRLFADGYRYAAEARERWPDHPWAATIRATVLAAHDRRSEALGEVEAALERFPTSVFAHHLRVHYLSLLERREDAVRAAHAAIEVVQEHLIPSLAASLLVEAGRRDEALALHEVALRLAPLADRGVRQQHRLARLECLYLDGRFDEAEAVAREAIAEQHRRSRTPERRSYAERILDAIATPEGRARERIVLPVPFVAQRHMTCSPASLASIAGAWTRPGDHDAIAAEICTDGTPMELSRDWAERHGWDTAEFLPDVASTRALIRQRVPFAIHSAWLGGAHSQTLMGFDERTGTAVVREPTVPRFIEFPLELTMKVLPMHALVGLVMVPKDSPAAAALRDAALPGREQMELVHRMRLGWREGDEAAAEQAFATLVKRFPGDDITLALTADRAARIGNDVEVLEALAVLCERFPDDDLLVRRHASTLRSLGRMEEADAVLGRRVGQRRAAPGLLLDQASLWIDRGLPTEKIEKMVMRAARRGHTTAECLAFLAELRLRDGRGADACRLLRLNSYVAPSHENSIQMWLRALRETGGLAEALRELEARIDGRDEASTSEVFESDRGGAARELVSGLAMGLWMSGQRAAALERVEGAAKRWPDDLELATLRVRYRRASGRLDEAGSALDELKGRISASEWLFERASLAAAREDRGEQIRMYREILAIDPTSRVAWSGLRELANHPQAIDDLAGQLQNQFARMPSYWTVADVLSSLYTDRAPERGIRVVEMHLDAFPTNPAAWTRLAQLHRAVGDQANAVRAARSACEFGPHAAFAWTLLADVLFDGGSLEESRRAAERSLDLESGDANTIDRVLRTLPDVAARSAWLRARWDRVLTRPRSAPAIHALANSSSALPLDEIQELIAQCDMSSSESEPIYAMGVILYARAGRYDDAIALVTRMSEHYPASERVRSLRCDILLGAKRWGDAIKVAEAWTRDFPHAIQPLRVLAAAYRSNGQQTEAADAIRRWTLLAPLDTIAARQYSIALSELDRGDEAATHLEEAWRRTESVEIAWARIDLLAVLDGKRPARERTRYAEAIRAMLPHLHDPEDAVRRLNARFPGTPWQRAMWWEALESAVATQGDQAPPGVRSMWGFAAIARDSPRRVLSVMSKRFTSPDATEDVLGALAYVAAYRNYNSLIPVLVPKWSAELRRRPSSFLTLADALWVAERKRDVTRWVAGWERRGDLLAHHLRTLARILDACGDHDAAIAAATRGTAIADDAEYAGLLAIRAVALVQKGDFDQARLNLQTIVETTADDESEALAEWGLKAIAVLDGPPAETPAETPADGAAAPQEASRGRSRTSAPGPDRAAVKRLSGETTQLREFHHAPITSSLFHGIARALVARGVPAHLITFRPESFTTRLDRALRERWLRISRTVEHAGFDLLAPIHRLLGLDRCRF